MVMVDGPAMQQLLQELIEFLSKHRTVPALATACLVPSGTRGENMLGLLLRRLIENERLGKPVTWPGE